MHRLEPFLLRRPLVFAENDSPGLSAPLEVAGASLSSSSLAALFDFLDTSPPLPLFTDVTVPSLFPCLPRIYASSTPHISLRQKYKRTLCDLALALILIRARLAATNLVGLIRPNQNLRPSPVGAAPSPFHRHSLFQRFCVGLRNGDSHSFCWSWGVDVRWSLSV